MEEKKNSQNELPKEWRRLMSAAEQMGFGRMEIIISDGKPVMIEIATQHVKLNGPDNQNGNIRTIKI